MHKEFAGKYCNAEFYVKMFGIVFVKGLNAFGLFCGKVNVFSCSMAMLRFEKKGTLRALTMEQ